MNDKKRHIIESAIKCFAQKGFHATSIQEIADSAGIAKGSLYFYFKSKEHLLLSIFEYGFHKLMTQMQSLADDASKSPRERLERQIELQFSQFVENKELIIMIFKEQSLQINEDLKQFLFAMRAQTLSSYRTHIAALYGDAVTPYLSDAAAMFSGLQNEYSQFVLLSQETMDFARLAHFLTERLDDLVQGMIAKAEPPIFNESITKSFLEKAQLFTRKKEATVFDEIAQLRKSAEQLPLERHLRDELSSTIQVLQAEFEKPEPQKIIVRGMLAVLKDLKKKELRKSIAAIEAHLKE